MTEGEWLACHDPQPMLESLRDKVSDRKLRLFAFASERRLWQFDSFDSAVAHALYERFIGGDDNRKELRGVLSSQRRVRGRYHSHQMAKYALSALADRIAYESARRASEFATGYVYFVTIEQNQRHGSHPAEADKALVSMAETARDAERREQVRILQCITGNPFRPVILDSVWLTWKEGTIPKLAQAIYDDRAFDRLPVLADALEGAGCTNADILNHCRQPGPHVRGCWVIDLLLGKE